MVSGFLFWNSCNSLKLITESVECCRRLGQCFPLLAGNTNIPPHPPHTHTNRGLTSSVSAQSQPVEVRTEQRCSSCGVWVGQPRCVPALSHGDSNSQGQGNKVHGHELSSLLRVSAVKQTHQSPVTFFLSTESSFLLRAFHRRKIRGDL